ncbi:MAG: COX15/CtaA family protein, partial [Burkholderiales bacterium]|nr:COX15/CtaA family protein [Burkholderiales bacterium]
AGMGVHLLHRLATLATLTALGMLALSAWQAKRRREAALLVALAALQVELGVTLVLAQLPLAAALAHNLLAALLLGTVAALAARSAPLSPRL